jgi:hypothetical protein
VCRGGTPVHRDGPAAPLRGRGHGQVHAQDHRQAHTHAVVSENFTFCCQLGPLGDHFGLLATILAFWRPFWPVDDHFSL